jgi:branched-chain amino acid transport system permease protein
MTGISDLATPLMMGVFLGGLYVLIALGLSMVFGVMRLINVAHGDLVILATYFAFFGMTGEIMGHRFTIFGIDPIVSLVIIIPILFGIGYGIQKFLMSRAFGISMEAPLIIAFGLSLIIQNTCQRFWTPLSRGLTTPYALESFSIGPFHVPLAYLLDFIAALVVMLLLREFLNRTYLGKAINAASQDKRAAHLMGVNTGRVYAFAFAIAMATAAVGGVFLGLTFPFTPTSGVSFLIIAFGVVIIGGLGSMTGTFIGGMILGLAQTFGGYFAGATAQMLIVYLLVLVVLASRPQGIFGR